jgi:diaminohydroxyphosphoribosylaminopyrimidine deaminase / 5-amino-6-(5-phosphoribosylamino)uracil reductase
MNIVAQQEENDLKYMQRAISLAKMAGGETRPNPLVGAVIVKNGEIIGEGYHARAGEAHAEVNALNNCKSRDMVRGADIYVSLEPCSHWGKTPPCAEMIVREGFKRVIIGTLDTSSKVSGKGVEILEKGGCEVLTGILEDECREVNKRFFTWHEKGRPYIILKWAKSKDGYIDLVRSADTPCGPNWITGIEERVLVHKWRSEEHSVMIGENTLVNDDPTLDVRYWKGFNPVRVIVSGSRKVPGDFKVLNDGKGAIFFTPYPGKAINGIEQIEISRGSCNRCLLRADQTFSHNSLIQTYGMKLEYLQVRQFSGEASNRLKYQVKSLNLLNLIQQYSKL